MVQAPLCILEMTSDQLSLGLTNHLGAPQVTPLSANRQIRVTEEEHDNES